MQFKLLIVNTLYPNYIKSYYKKFPTIQNQPYQEQYDHILDNASEMITSYTKTFNEISVETKCIILNALPLQKKWLSEKGLTYKSNKTTIFEQIKDYQPDALWLGNKRIIDRSFINNIRSSIKNVKLIFSYFCSPYNNLDIPNFKHLDFILTCTPGYRENFEKDGIKSYLSYHAFDKSILPQLNNEDNISTILNNIVFAGSLFLGSGYHNQRIELIEAILKNDIDIKIYGNLESRSKIMAKKVLFYSNRLLHKLKLGKLTYKIPYLNQFDNEWGLSYYSSKVRKSIMPPLFGNDMLKLIKGFTITLNNHVEVAGDYAGNMRLFEATGVGTCLLTDNKKNMPELFDTTKEVVTYENTDDCIDKIKWLLNNPEDCKKITQAGQERTLKSHTIKQRCESISDIINKELKNK